MRFNIGEIVKDNQSVLDSNRNSLTADKTVASKV
jgi:hypothetical protein